MKYFTSDYHIGHQRILELGDGRPFESLAHMHSTLMERAWETVGPDDEFYLLGDMAMGNFDESLRFLSWLPGHKFLVPGNHDKIFPKLNSASRIERFTPLYEEAGLTVLSLHSELTLADEAGDVEVLLSHVPYTPERFNGRADKLAFARPADEGKWLIHGHTHSAEKASEHPREIHVGVDANDWTPVSEASILARIRA